MKFPIRKWLLRLAGALALFSILVYHGNTLLILLENDRPSKSVGTAEQGRLINGKRMPSRGDNFRAYSYLGATLGRSATHHKVRDLLLDCYRQLKHDFPEKQFVYGEIGWPRGGRFYPHKTHQNGLAIDFMVPLQNQKGRSVPIPTNLFNRFGYGVDFNREGNSGRLSIDFDAMAAHIHYLMKYASRYQVRIDRIIFDPRLQPYLKATRYGKEIMQQIHFNRKQAWVRHDDHYHVNFSLIE